MVDHTTERVGQDPHRYSRILGRIRGKQSGPTLVAMAGIHGNEQAGVQAALNVLARFDRDAPEIVGELVLIAGNLTALQRKSRFIELDLNRQWTPEKVAALGTEGADAVEHGEQRELLEVLRDVVDSARGPLHCLDLHTSSAEGPPFLTVGDTLRNRKLADAIPLPLILGLEEQVDGALLELLNNHGFVTVGVEAGRHDAPESPAYLEAVIWLALAGTGLLAEDSIPDRARHRELLLRSSRGVASVIEVRRRHAMTRAHGFRMEPGFVNFQPVREGQLLAHDRNGPVTAPEDGLILLPLYQGQGEDGFFICREVRPFWLKVSMILRRLRLDALVRLLPGVRRHPKRPEVLVIDTRVARIYPLEVFHLLGFRKIRQVGIQLMVSRRRYDLAPPARISPL